MPCRVGRAARRAATDGRLRGVGQGVRGRGHRPRVAGSPGCAALDHVEVNADGDPNEINDRLLACLERERVNLCGRFRPSPGSALRGLRDCGDLACVGPRPAAGCYGRPISRSIEPLLEAVQSRHPRDGAEVRRQTSWRLRIRDDNRCCTLRVVHPLTQERVMITALVELPIRPEQRETFATEIVQRSERFQLRSAPWRTFLPAHGARSGQRFGTARCGVGCRGLLAQPLAAVRGPGDTNARRRQAVLEIAERAPRAAARTRRRMGFLSRVRAVLSSASRYSEISSGCTTIPARLASLNAPQSNRYRMPPGLPGRGRRKSMQTRRPVGRRGGRTLRPPPAGTPPRAFPRPPP